MTGVPPLSERGIFQIRNLDSEKKIPKKKIGFKEKNFEEKKSGVIRKASAFALAESATLRPLQLSAC